MQLDRITAVHSAHSMASMHAHADHELFFLISGQRRYFVGHTIYDVSPGNLVFIPKNRLHRTTAPGKIGYDRYVLYFREEAIASFISQLGQPAFDALMEAGCVQLPAELAQRVEQDLGKMEQELRTDAPYSRAMAAHLLEDILLIALRHGIPKSCSRGENVQTIQAAARYISEHYAENITLRDAAQMAHMERTYFSKRFKELTGFGFLEYLTQVRLREAQRLLLETDMSIGAVSELCGFSGSNYFGDVFSRWKGMSPSQYRASHRNGPAKRFRGGSESRNREP